VIEPGYGRDTGGSSLPCETAVLVAAGATRWILDDSHGRLIESTESRYPGDRYALDVQFDLEGPDDPLPDDVS
jgi:hypothetical protein